MLRNITLGPLFQERKQARQRRTDSMKWLSLACLTIASKYRTASLFNFLRFAPANPICRYRSKGVFGKGVGNSKNVSEMRQKCVKNASKMALVLLGKEERSKMRQKCVNLRQKCVKNARNTFGGEHLLDDTEFGWS